MKEKKLSDPEIKEILTSYVHTQMDGLETEKIPGNDHSYSKEYERRREKIFGSKKAFNKYSPAALMLKRMAVAACILLSLIVVNGVSARVLGFDPLGSVTTFFTEDDERTANYYQTSDGKVHQYNYDYLKKAKNDPKKIVWILPSFSDNIRIKFLKKFNDLLKENGFDMELEACFIREENDYYGTMMEYVKNGYGDLCHIGYFTDEEKELPRLQKMLDHSCFKELSALLQKKAGKELSDAFSEFEWNSVTRDSGIHLIPSQQFDPVTAYAAFSKKYFEKKNLQAFHGDLTELPDLLSEKAKKDLQQDAILWGLYGYETLNVLGIHDEEGVWIDHATGKVMPGFHSGRYEALVRKLHQYDTEGYINKMTELYEDFEAPLEDKILNNDFGIAVFSNPDMAGKLRDNSYVMELPHYYTGNAYSGTSIVSASKKADACLQLLALLYARPEYANRLLYGKNGWDYMLIDGKPHDMNYHEMSGEFLKSILGIADMAYNNGDFSKWNNIKAGKQQYFSSPQLKISILNRIKLDTSKRTGIVSSGGEYHTMWQKEDFEKRYKNAQDYFADIEKNDVNLLQKQINKQLK